MKTLSRKSNWPFHASRKIRKTASRSQKKASNHVSRKNTNHIHAAQAYIQIRSPWPMTMGSCTNTIITNVFKHFCGFSRSKCVYFPTLWIDRNTMTIFEVCLLYRNLFYLRLECATFERTSIVMPSMVSSNGHCRSWCTRQELTSLFLEKQTVFTPGKHAETSILEIICSMNR